MMTPDEYRLKKALISVSDKSGIDQFAKELVDLGFEIYSTGGTEKFLRTNGIPVHAVEEITGFPEILDGRVKTLHPVIHAGLLAELDKAEHLEQLGNHGINSIDLLVVNLYPFEKTLAKPGASHEELVENIDIGGPTMLRAAAKNYRWTAVVVNPSEYDNIIGLLKERGCTLPVDYRKKLAGDVFIHTAYYDSVISNYFISQRGEEFPEKFTVPFIMEQKLRYGENPHQDAALFGRFSGIYQKLHGKELSYNNIVDIDAAGKLVLEFEEPVFAIIKHTNPSGVATADTLAEAYNKAFATDTDSPYGGIFAVNRKIDLVTAQTIHGIFSEVIIAPGFDDDALELLTKKKDRRLIVVDLAVLRKSIKNDIKSVAGGFLMQNSDTRLIDEQHGFKVVTKRQPTKEELESLLFGWKVAKHVKSNAIVYSASDRTLGVGAGQMSRKDSSRIAVEKAKMMGLDLTGSTMASDAFFPFPDGVIEAIEAGATAVIQPGGSIRDAEVIKAADDNNVAMVYTGMRHFRH